MLEQVHVLMDTKGIDIQKYDYIIHFDLPNRIRSYILSSKGSGQSDTSYIVFLERYD
jgi:hypothetical protein